MKTQLKKFLFLLFGSLGTLLVIVLAASQIVRLTGYKTEYYGPGLEKRVFNFSKKEVLYSDFFKAYVGPRVDFINNNNGDSLIPYRNEGEWGYFSLLTGKKIIDENENVFEFAFPFSKTGLAAVVLNDSIRFIDRQGKIKINTSFRFNKNIDKEIFFDSDGLALIPLYDMVKGEFKFSLIDTTGKIIQNKMDSVGENECGLRIVGLNNLYGVINMTGKFFLDIIYDEILITENIGIIVRQGSRQKLLGFDKTILVENVFDNIYPLRIEPMKRMLYEEDLEENQCYSDEFYRVEINEYAGVCKKNGDLIVPCRFSGVTALSDSAFKAEIWGKIFLYDATGKILKNSETIQAFSNTK